MEKPTSRFHGKPSKASIKRIIDLRDNLVRLLREISQLPWSTRCDHPLPHIDQLNDELNDRLSLYSITQVFQRYDGKDLGIDGAVGGERRITVGVPLGRIDIFTSGTAPYLLQWLNGKLAV